MVFKYPLTDTSAYTTIDIKMNLISATYARNNFSQLLNEVIGKGKKFVLIRDSTPMAVIVPYGLYCQDEEKWRISFDRCLLDLKKQFKKYLKEEKIPYPKTEEEVYGQIDRITGRH